MQANAEFIKPEECRQLVGVMERKYASFMKARRFEMDVKKDGTGVYAKVTLHNADNSFFYPVEARIAHDDHEMTDRDAGLFLLDYIDAYFEEYFREAGEVYLPIDWADYECDGVPFQLKGQILNLEVERMADELLAKNGGLADDGTALH